MHTDNYSILKNPVNPVCLLLYFSFVLCILRFPLSSSPFLLLTQDGTYGGVGRGDGGAVVGQAHVLFRGEEALIRSACGAMGFQRCYKLVQQLFGCGTIYG